MDNLDHQEQINQAFLEQRHALLAYIGGLSGDLTGAEDIFQEVWIHLNRAMHAGKEIPNVQGWCRVTARNLIIDRWRSEKTRNVTFDSELLELVDKAFEEAENNIWHDRKWALQHCMEQLPEHASELIRMRY